MCGRAVGYNGKNHCLGSAVANGQWIGGWAFGYGCGQKEGRSKTKGRRDARSTFPPTTGQLGRNVLPPAIPPQPRCLLG